MPSVQKRIASSPRATNLLPSSAGTRPRSRSLPAASCWAAMSHRMQRARRLACGAGDPSGRRPEPAAAGGLTITGSVIPSARTSISTSSYAARKLTIASTRLPPAATRKVGSRSTTSATWDSSGSSAPTSSATFGRPCITSSGRRSTGSVITGRRRSRRTAAGDTRRSIGRAHPSCASTYHPGLPSNQAPLVVVKRRGSPWRWKDVFTTICDPSGESSRSNRGRRGSSPKRSSIICGSTMTRRPFKAGSRSLASSPRTSIPTRRGP